MFYNSSAKFALGERNVLTHAKFAPQAKCASHALGEFSLAASKKLFRYEATRNNLALRNVQNLAKPYL